MERVLRDMQEEDERDRPCACILREASAEGDQVDWMSAEQNVPSIVNTHWDMGWVLQGS